MTNDKKIIAMIPARIGSKRIPKKNLRLINGKPLISYVIETIIKTNIFDDVYLNADDKIFDNIKFYTEIVNLQQISQLMMSLLWTLWNMLKGIS